MVPVFFRDEDYAYNEPSCGYKQSFGYQKQAQDFVWHLGRVYGDGGGEYEGRGSGGGLRGRATLAGKSEISGYKDLVNDACVSVHRDWS